MFRAKNTARAIYKGESQLVAYSVVKEKVSRLLSVSRSHQRAYIVAQFELGKYIAELQDNSSYGSQAVLKLAEELTKEKGYTVYPQRLWECARVWRAFGGDIQRVWKLEKELRISITWSFLVKNAPAPDVLKDRDEFIAYWKDKLSRWEQTLLEMEETASKLDTGELKLPEELKEETAGLIKASGVSIESKLKRLFRAIEKLLEALEETEITPEIEEIFERIDSRIHTILKK